MPEKFTLVVSSPDRIGIVAAITRLLADELGLLIESHQHTDVQEGWFFMRNIIDTEGLVDTSRPTRNGSTAS